LTITVLFCKFLCTFSIAINLVEEGFFLKYLDDDLCVDYTSHELEDADKKALSEVNTSTYLNIS